MKRRHPYEVTADRLGDHLTDTLVDIGLTGKDKDTLSYARQLLIELADGTYEP